MSEHQIHVSVISTSTIKIKSTAARINLTPWDLELLFLEYSQKGLLYLNPTPLEEASIITKSNSINFHNPPPQSLPPTRPPFLPACRWPPHNHCIGRRRSHLLPHRLYKRRRNFCSRTTNGENENCLTVADIVNSNYVPEIVRSFFQLNGVRNYDGVSTPLLAVQVTEVADGLFIGCSINHMLADGTSFWHFFNSWAEISRGNHTISKLSFLNRDRVNLDLIGCTKIYIPNQVLDYNKNLKISASPPLLRDQIFHLCKESIANLKKRANQEKGGKIVSSLQAVVAHVWMSIIRYSFGSSEETSFEISMGARQRLDPPLPEEYFGNAVFPGVLTLECENLLMNRPGWVGWRLNEMVAGNNGPEKVRDFCLGWVKSPNFLEFEGLPSNYFILINSPRFDVYGNDFGWGEPVAARSEGANGSDGRITVTRELEEGSLEIEACLTPETLTKLTEEAEFMKFVTSKY